MIPGRYDLEMYRGDTHPWRVVLWEDDDQEMPYDLTGSTVAAQIRNKSAGTTIVDLEVIVTLPNIIDLMMRPDMFVTCPVKGVWDVQVTTVDGDVLTPLAGNVTVLADVTDSLPPGRLVR
jgi:hypothetical protein